MAKRTADTQLTKDGVMLDDDGGYGGVAPTRATAAQMANRKLAQPRGSRRPGARRPPMSPQTVIPGNNGQIGGQQNGSSIHQASASFPPFGSGSTTGFNTSFTAPSGAFSFNQGQDAPASNPFSRTSEGRFTVPPTAPGFHGSIFNVNADMRSAFTRDCEGEQPPVFAPHSPFQNNDQQSDSVPNQTQVSNPFALSAPQQQSNQASPNLFAQSSPQQSQQPSSNLFGRNTEQQPKQSTTDMFAHLKTPQTQNAPNPFAQSLTSFQQSQPNQPSTNIFGNLGPQPGQQSSNPFGQTNTSAPSIPQPNTSPGDSVMQISPDASPQSGAASQSRPFSFLTDSSPNVQSRTSPSKTQAPSAEGGSLFGRVSRPSTEADAQAAPASTSSTQAEGGSISGATSKSLTSAAWTPKELKHDSRDIHRATGPSKEERKFTKSKAHITEDTKPMQSNPFTSLKVPTTSQPSAFPTRSELSGAPKSGSASAPSTSPLGGLISSSAGQTANHQLSTISDEGRTYGAPPLAPSDFSEEEKRQLITGYRLKALDVGFQNYLCNNNSVELITMARNFYIEKKRAILAADGGEVESLAGSKRKAADEQPGPSGVHEKMIKTGNVTSGFGSALPDGSSPHSPTQISAPLQQPINTKAKRKADDELTKENTHTEGENGKKVRSADQVSYPSLSSSSLNSQTSSIFKNILGAKNQESPELLQTKVNSNHQAESPFASSTISNLFQPKLQSSPSKDSTTNNATNGTNAPSASLFPPKPTSTTSMPPPPNPFTASLSKPSFTPSTTNSSTSPFLFKPTINNNASIGTPKASAFNSPALGSTASSSSAQSNPFAAKPAHDTDGLSGQAKASAFKPPTFGDGAPVNFLSQFGKAAAKTADEEKKKRKADDYDSDEEDEAAWERRDAEEQRIKKQKFEEAAKGKGPPKFVPGKGFVYEDTEDDRAPETSQAASSALNTSIFDRQHAPQNLPNGHNIFSPFSDVDSGAEGSKTGDADDDDDDEDQHESDEDEEQRQKKDMAQAEDEEQVPANKTSSTVEASSNPLGSMPASASPSKFLEAATTGRSLFGRTSKADTDNAAQEMPMTDPKPSTGNMFGSTFKTINNNSSSSIPEGGLFGKLSSSTPTQNVFGTRGSSVSLSDAPASAGSSKGDHTWKAESPIKFGATSSQPSVSLTSPSPTKPAFSGLFGSPKTNPVNESPNNPASSIFSATPSQSSNAGLGFAFSPSKPPASSLAPPSKTASNATSRATSPGATTGESANESPADGEDDKVEHHDQLDLVSVGPGEEEEEVLFEVRAKAMQFDTKSKKWESKAVGPFRILKHRNTKKTRMLLRQEPSGRVALNAALNKAVGYEDMKNKSVKVPIPMEGGIESWVIKVGKAEDAEKLAKILEENKAL